MEEMPLHSAIYFPTWKTQGQLRPITSHETFEMANKKRQAGLTRTCNGSLMQIMCLKIKDKKSLNTSILALRLLESQDLGPESYS